MTKDASCRPNAFAVAVKNESIRKLPRTPDTLISEEVKAPIPNAVAAGHACSAIFVRTSVAGANVLVSSVYQYYVRKQIPTNSLSLRCLSIPTIVVRPLSVVITAS